jgi:hypothetical protein
MQELIPADMTGITKKKRMQEVQEAERTGRALHEETQTPGFTADLILPQTVQVLV